LIGVDGLDRAVPDAVLDPAGDGGASCSPGAAIAVIVPLTGESSHRGLVIRDAAVAAVGEFTAANPACELRSRSSTTRAPTPAA
jgi:branched-chain amino acid transport system substrate-binding protein